MAIRPSTGAVLAAANGAGNGDSNLATVGQSAPGSTFKVAIGLALLRAGLKPSSEVKCPPTVTSTGGRFKNYSDYPSSQLGRSSARPPSLSPATPRSSVPDQASDGDLAAAAVPRPGHRTTTSASRSFFGECPTRRPATGHAAAMIGQAKVVASPSRWPRSPRSVQAGGPSSRCWSTASGRQDHRGPADGGRGERPCSR